VRDIVANEYTQIKQAHDRIKGLRDATKS
jgi:hypothetical protein